MCGIVGYTGERQADELLLAGLAQLEYRGYDSTGICVAGTSGLHRVRAANNLAALRDAVAADTMPTASSGIGHTRWATHGEVSISNTHPFTGCATGPYAVALNGIIENFSTLRDQLILEGHDFESTTDAEVVVHLLERHQELDLHDALRSITGDLHGHFGIVVLDQRRPGLVVGTRRQVPLVVGVGRDEHFVCSSVDALLTHTNRFVYLEDYDIAILDGGSLTMLDSDGKIADRAVTTVERAAPTISHVGYTSFMAKEIAQQPQAISDTLSGRIDGASVRIQELASDGAADTLRLVAGGITDIERLVIVGCGTALHAGQVARPMFEGWARIHTEAAIASEWRHSNPIVDSKTLVVAISQSGETADTLEAVRTARRLGAMTFGITNMADSQLTREVDRTILTRAGLEVSVAATKTFTAQVATLALLAFEIASSRSTMDELDAELALIELELIPEKMAGLFNRLGSVERIADVIADAPFVVFLGRGSGVPVALEGALKLREIAYMPAEVHPAGELKHGSIALIERGTPVVAVVTDGTEPERTLSNLHEVKARGAHIIAVATEGNTEILSVADDVMWVPKTLPLLEPLLNVVPLQQLAHDVAVARGLNVDQPRNLAKTVTVE
jgi:glucosamine--fructose-6-phosphate aminotransferase (isomerizing)